MDVEFRKNPDGWTEVGAPDLPAPPQRSWTGRQRTFTSLADKVWPPLWKPDGSSMK
jgi:hypothetical protein